MGAILTLSSGASLASGGGFYGGVSPSRIKLASDSGKIVQQSLKIYNLGNRPAKFSVKTADWTYSEQGAIEYFQELQPGSCRPWVRLERHEINVVPSSTRPRNFRLEFHIPKDAPRQECRLAIMIESLGEPHMAELGGGAVKLPVMGRVAVMAYLAVNGAEPQLKLKSVTTLEHQGQTLPAVEVSNEGDAHGRLSGQLTATGRDKKSTLLNVSSSPIMPGQTRLLLLSPSSDKGDAEAAIDYPLHIDGRIFAQGETFKVETEVSP